MNKNLHRIIFNAKRGLRMAVAETASSQGKGGSGESGGGSTGGLTEPLACRHPQATRGALTLAAMSIIGVALWALPLPAAHAQIVADPNAPANQRPTVLQTFNGLPQVNIQTPSAAGVSRNTYSQFDVGPQGAILNNSRTNTQTQLGGWVQGNPWLATGSARVILNEVNSSSPSQLKGYVEVAGQRAEVIIANPAGIAVNGGGFLNAASVTLTTGTPVINTGALESYRVQRGSISIEGAGLDTSTADYTNILARSVQVNAGLWAKDLKVVTGANDIAASNAATPSVTGPASTIGAAPAFALDVSQLGGMYAGKIFLVGTEAGVGVSNAGTIGATAGDVVVQNNGWLSNSGNLRAAGNTQLTTTGDVTNNGTLYASGNTSITSQGSINNQASGLIAAQANTTLQAAAQVNAATGSVIAAGLNTDGSIASTGDLEVNAGRSAALNGKTLAGGNASVSGTHINLSSGTLSAQNVSLMASTGDINANVATLSAQATLKASAAASLITDGAQVSASQLQLGAHDLSNVGGKLQQSGTGDLSIALAGNLDNTQGVIASNSQNISLSANTLTNTAGKMTHAGTGTLAVVATTLNGNAGTIISNGALNLQADSMDLQNATTTASHIAITGGDLNNQGGQIVQSGKTADASIAISGALNNTGGTIASNAGLQINAASVTNANASITAMQSLMLTSAGQVSNTAGKIAAAGDVGITSANLLNGSAGRIGSNGALSLSSDNIQNADGQIVGAGNVTLNGASGASSATALLDNTAGLVQSGATLSVKANQLINAGTYTPPAANTTALGLVGQDVQIAANSLNNQSGEVLASHNLTVQAAQSIDNSGGNANSQGGLLYAANALKIQDSALLANPAATRTLQVVNTSGTINAGSRNQVQAADVTGDGQLLSQGDLSLDVSADFNNSATVNANGNTTIKSAGTIQNSGTLSAGQTLTVSAVNLNNAASGTLSGVDATQVLLSNTLTNRGLIDSGNAAGTSLTLIKAQTVNNLGSGRIYGDNIAIGANTLTNDAETVSGVTKAAVIASRNSLDIGVQTLSNNNGATLLSLGDMAVGGALDANHRATGDATSVTNSASLIQSVNANMTINTATLQNLNPTFSYQVVNGTPSAEHTEYILTNGQTVQDSQVAMDNGKLHTYTEANGFTAPYGKVLLSSDPLATATNIAIYQEADVATYTKVLTGYTDKGGFPVFATQTSVAAPQNSQIWVLVGMATPANPPPTGIRPADTITTDTGATVHNPAVDVWDAAAAPYIALQSQIDALRTQLDSHMFTVQSYNQYTTATQQAVVNGGTPGTISSAGNITIHASSSARNDNSRILAGGALSVLVPGKQLDNTSTNVSVQADKTGYNFNWYCVNDVGTSHCGVAYYNQFALWDQPNLRQNPFTQSTPTTVQVGNSQALQYTSVAPPGAVAGAAAGGGAVAGTLLASQTSSTAGTTTAHSGTSAAHVASTSLNITLPNSALYQINSSPSAHYLVQTDPAFTNYQTWLSSDYISAQNALDPSVTQKRLGDGFYEQQLIREQVAQLTGRRFLGDFTSDQQQYLALMDSGLTYAKAQHLSEGIALSAAQVANLTSDIVWLQQETVTLPNGSTTTALVPHLYAAIQPGDLAPSGALLSGNSVTLQTGGDVNNSGTILGRTLVKINADNINNTVGSISAQSVDLHAAQDINNIGGAVMADNNLTLNAGHDINVTSTTQSSTGSGGAYQLSQSGIDRVATLYTRGPGTLKVSAGNDAKLTAAQVSSGGDAQISVGNNLTLSTLTSSRSDNFNAGNADNHFNASSSQDIGTTIQSAGKTALSAGSTLSATAATVNATGDLRINAKNVDLLAGQSKTSSNSVMSNSDSDLFSSTSSVTRNSQSSTSALASSVGGKNVSITATNDITVKGSQVLADQDINATAGHNLTITAATSTSSSETHKVESNTGWSSAGFGISYGTTTTTTDQQQQGSIQSGTQERSMVGSVSGSVKLKAGSETGALKISGSDVQAGQDIIATGASVQIDPGQDRNDATTKTKTVTDAVTLAVGGSVVNAAQTLQSLGTAASNTKNKRMQALATAAQAMAAAQAAAAVAADGGSISASVTANHSESTTTQTDTSTSNAGSQLTAARNVQITATGKDAGTGTDASNPDSGNLNIIGSNVSAGNNVALKASKDINIVSAQDTEAHQTDHSDWTVGAGVGVAASSTGGPAFGATGNVGVGVATQKSQASTQLNSHITAGKSLSVESTRDTNIQGGVLSADSVNVDVGRNLNIASQQDTASASAKSASASVSVTAGYGVSVSASLAYAKSQNDFASVDEQSGIKAGNGGFNINVKGNADLKGGVITSTQAAVEQNKNSLSTATLTQSDIANHSTADGIGLSGGLSYSTGGSNQTKDENGKTITGTGPGGIKTTNQGNAGAKVGATSLGAASESDSSTTRSAISGATLTIGSKTTRTNKGEVATDSSGKAINTAATTGTDTAAKLSKPSSLEDIQAQVQITQSFGSQASKAVGDYADSKLNDAKKLQAQANQTSDPEQKAALQKQADDLNSTWGEGGAGRVALHTVVGGLTGNTAGAVGAAAASSTAPTLNELQTKISQGLKDAGVSDSVAESAGKIISGTTAVGIGAVAGGGAVGGAAAGNEDFNNRQLHPVEAKLIKDNAKAYAKQRGISVDRAEAELTQQAERNNDSAHAERLGASDATAQAFLTTLGAGKTMTDGLTGQTYQLFSADQATRDNHAEFGQYAKTSPQVQQLLDKAYTTAYKPKDGQTIAGVNGSNAGALTGSDLALNDAARDYGNMRKQPAVVQWAVLGELRQERQANLQSQLALTEELQRLNQKGDTSAAAASRRGEIINRLTQLDAENTSLRQASVAQIGAMGSVGLLKPIDQREWGEGAGSAIGASGLGLKGVSTASIAGKVGMLREAVKDTQAATAAAKAEVVAVANARVENNATADMAGYGSSAVRDFKAGEKYKAENINAGQVTDRDGLPRIDETKKINDEQVAQNLGQTKAPYYGTQRPAWMEGTTVEDKVLAKPETYRMVVNESEYRAIEDAIDKGDVNKAVQNLGGWATKDTVTSATDVRGKLAISSEWKGQDGQGMYVIEFTAKPGVGVREGTVGPMFDDKIKMTLPGGGHQVQFLDKSPRTNPELYQINLSNSGKLK